MIIPCTSTALHSTLSTLLHNTYSYIQREPASPSAPQWGKLSPGRVSPHSSTSTLQVSLRSHGFDSSPGGDLRTGIPHYVLTRVTPESLLFELFGYHPYGPEGGYSDAAADEMHQELEADVGDAVGQSTRVAEWHATGLLRGEDGWAASIVDIVSGERTDADVSESRLQFSL
ncbi:hypothetical protein PYCCODRAFT_1097428 [Trametes coccinea BRFM310]|uniref:Uncharacterized protein n=1 Tax=Trametes coccinea (strain BRFM310) TaxID=1353009 RepID=A0A1Y2IBP1_TRAC3|nr:hypothetical protein PYCCODRAFT_1097428 [Trametes coccinea BRFM310]